MLTSRSLASITQHAGSETNPSPLASQHRSPMVGGAASTNVATVSADSWRLRSDCCPRLGAKMNTNVGAQEGQTRQKQMSPIGISRPISSSVRHAGTSSLHLPSPPSSPSSPKVRDSNTDVEDLQVSAERRLWGCLGRHQGPCGHRGVWYHGTSVSSAEQILKHGFQPSDFGTLGPGIYLARNREDTDMYSQGVVLACRVCSGKCWRMKGQNNTWQMRGFDSAFTEGGIRGIVPQICVSSSDRVRIISIGMDRLDR
eukprot:TRINITY_DN23344_c0_g1_i1.p1 TRINITY_DN23344_c0_g1~~TRINITY_DN23344_c0_g1_i1.p1  ORF type:complete len:256 (-),score=12.45 TRINITY_DN23344_c0_g1_i1:384-1151(-)